MATTTGQPKFKVTLWAQDPIPQYLAYLEGKRYARKTIRNYRLDLNMIQRQLGYPIYIATGDALAEYIRSQKHLQAASVEKKLACLRGFFKWALKHGVVQADPTVDLEGPKRSRRIPIHLSEEEVEAMLAALRYETPVDLREAAMIATLYYTGCRAGELNGMDVDSWDPHTGYVRVVGKGDKERLIPVPHALAAILNKWLAVHPLGKGPMFTSLGPDAGRLKEDRIRGIFRQVMKRAGLAHKRYTPHKLRHTYATRLINHDVSIDKIQKLLGHVDISTTTIYAHTMIGKDTIEALERIL